MRSLMILVMVLPLAGWLSGAAAESAAQPTVKIATSKLAQVTVYTGSALVTREVDVPEGTGIFELIVSPLPTGVVDSSLYSEGNDTSRVLTTRARTKVVQEDIREEVRKLQAQLKELQLRSSQVAGDMETVGQNQRLLEKLEDFTSATTKQLTEKGLLSSDQTIKLATFVMTTRSDHSKQQVNLQHQLEQIAAEIQFVQRQLQQKSAGSGRTEHEAVIVVDKRQAAAGKIRLNYLVNGASWRPQYKFRAGQAKEPVQVEYLAAVAQNTGEDWNNVQIVLSTAQPMLNAAPPELRALEVSLAQPVVASGPRVQGQAQTANNMPSFDNMSQQQLEVQSRALRSKAIEDYRGNRTDVAGKAINDAAAMEQWVELCQIEGVAPVAGVPGAPSSNREGPSVTYRLESVLSLPSRRDEQIVPIARLDLAPDYYYKAVPVLTSHIYRQADLVNRSEWVLLPGEATMYQGADFVGRSTLPLVAIGEQFTVGFGVDPQLQVQRRLLDRNRTVQGGNQVLKYDYRILVSSYKTEPVRLQLWDRLPVAENPNVAITLVGQAPELCRDPLYLREERTKNLLRWDLTIEPNTSGEKAVAVNYQFRVELDRQMQLGTFAAK